MKTLLILGAGTGGTMVANKMARKLDPINWQIIIIDQEEKHYYQPGFLFLPFGLYESSDVIKPKKMFLPSKIEVVFSEIKMIDPANNMVRLSNERSINYDYLVIATGSDIHPEETPGMLDAGWGKNIFDFYTFAGAMKLRNFLKTWQGGRLVLSVTEMPIKCPVAPLEFLCLADWYFHKRDMRNKVEIVFATPMPGAFTKPQASRYLGEILTKKSIIVEADYILMEVDNSKQIIRSYDEREIPYDLLVTIPTNMGSDVIRNSGMGDVLGFMPTDKHTLQSEQWENVFLIGDASNVPVSKAGSVAHFMLDIVVDNLLAHMNGREMKAKFDGHSNCFIETGFSKGILIDFNYEVEPLPGQFPLQYFGPFSLLKESYFNRIGKLSFKWIYWNILLGGFDIPFVESHMSMRGKQI
jgi:sulfide:quinone oxidoreductase